MEMTFKDRLKSETQRMESVVTSFLPVEEGYQKTVIEAMNYSVKAGGKRLRPLLMDMTFQMCGGKEKQEMLYPFLAAIEMIHTYSLVHDDLPSMDNDEYRRGKKTTWSVYGEAFAVLAGDGLLNYAFETATKAFDACSTIEEYQRVANALKLLSVDAGIYGMIGGQTADIEAENRESEVTEELLLFIHQHKTAKLIEAAMATGAILAGADAGQIEKLKKCAYDIGIAFQIQDDILDVIGDSRELGKPVGSDIQNHKQTYVTLKGLEQAKADVEKLSVEAIDILDTFEGEHQFLKELVESLIHRKK